MAVNSPILRVIAGKEVEKFLPHTIPAVRDDILTAVMRQWATCDGHAGIFTVAACYWLHLVRQDGGYQVGEEIHAGNSLRELLQRSGADEEELAEIVHELTLRQSATFENKGGVRLRVRAIPQEMQFEVEPADEDDA